MSTGTRRVAPRASALREVPADTGVLFVDGVPRATLRELSALARSSDMSRSALVRKILAGYLTVLAERESGVAA